jgi:O-antigen ligase
LQLEPMRHLTHHNTYLSVLTETGLIGFVPFLGLFAAWLWTGSQLWRQVDAPLAARVHAVWTTGAICVYAVQALFHELSYTPIDNSLLFLLTGVSAGLWAKASAMPRGGRGSAQVADRRRVEAGIPAERLFRA